MKALVAQGRFALFPSLMLAALVMTAKGGIWIWTAGIALLAVNLLGDEVTDEYFDRVDRPNRWFLDALLYAVPVLVAAMTVLMLLYTAAPGTPMAGLAAALGFDAALPDAWTAAAGATFTTGVLTAWRASRSATSSSTEPPGSSGFWASCCARAACIPRSRSSMSTAITWRSARRRTRRRRHAAWVSGVSCCAGCYGRTRGAATIEARRLARRGLPFLSSGNRFLQGLAMLAGLLATIVVSAGWSGLVAFIVSGLMGLVVLQLGNYISHYGLVRAPGCPVGPRHSWNAPRFVTTSVLINTPRHSHHHASAGTPYWGLTVMDRAPVHPHGWAYMSAAALVPPLWFRVMQPCLDAWDAEMASPDELAMLSAASAHVSALNGLAEGNVR